jgi:hypothetical protein
MTRPVPDLTGKVAETLHEVLTTWPLYRTLRYTTTSAITDAMPQRISLMCHSKACGKSQTWERDSKNSGQVWARLDKVTYTCRNCGTSKVHYHYNWIDPEDLATGVWRFTKIGQDPPLEEDIPAELRARLEARPEDLDFYVKAVRCRNFGYGLAALAYLRRVVENRMNDLLDLIAEVAAEHGFAAEERRALEDVKKSRVFDDKVTYAAKILPPSLKPGAQNPVDLLHDLASEGIHSLSEDECIDVFDKSRVVFEYLFRELEVRKEHAQKYVKDVQDLAARRAARSQSRGDAAVSKPTEDLA